MHVTNKKQKIKGRVSVLQYRSKGNAKSTQSKRAMGVVK
jgi:hypothetical protein